MVAVGALPRHDALKEMALVPSRHLLVRHLKVLQEVVPLGRMLSLQPSVRTLHQYIPALFGTTCVA
jgi:hypothetical protein